MIKKGASIHEKVKEGGRCGGLAHLFDDEDDNDEEEETYHEGNDDIEDEDDDVEDEDECAALDLLYPVVEETSASIDDR